MKPSPASVFRPRTKPHSVMACAVLCAISPIVGIVYAQEPPKSSPVAPQSVENLPTPNDATITVMGNKGRAATKTNAKIKDIPQAISTVTQQDIANRGATGVDEAAQHVSGVTSNVYGADARSEWIMVRGFKPARYLDGMPLPNGVWTDSSRIEPYGLSQIEVLKGPSSMLYGQIPPGGMIDLASKRPSEERVRELSFGYGTENRKHMAIDIGDANDALQTIQYRLVGVVRDGESVVDYVKDKRYYFAPSLALHFDTDTTLTLLARVQKGDSALAGGFLPMSGTLTGNPNGQISPHLFTGEPNYDRYEQNLKSIGYEFEHRLSPQWQFKQNARYATADVLHQSVGTLGFVEGSDRLLSRYVYPLTESSKMSTVDNQITGTVHTGRIRHDVIAGIDYRSGKNDYASGFGMGVAPLDAYDPVYGSPVTTPAYSYHQIQRQKQYGLYAQDQMSLDQWRVTTGLRHDWTNTKTLDAITHTESQQKDHAWSGRAALGYAVNDDLNAYTAYSTSFQPTIGTTFNGNAFKPSKGRQTELGLKYQPSARSLATLALFHLNQSNVAVVDPEHLFNSVQQGKIRVKGLESEAQLALNRQWQLNASYTYSDATITQTTDAALLNTHVPLIPKHKGSLGGRYLFTNGLLKKLALNAAWRYTGKHYGAAGDLYATPAYGLLDAGVGYEWDKWQLQLNINNVLDKQYVAACTQTYWCFYGQPRTANLTARYHW